MIGQKVSSHGIVTFADLKPLASPTGLCITIVEPLPKPAEIETRLKNAIRTVEKKLEDRGMDAKAISELTGPIHDAAAMEKTAGIWAHSLILLRSTELFRYYFLHGQFKEMLAVEDRFQIRPFLATVAREQRFHVLGLSRQHVRLWHCTHHRADEATYRGILPQNMETWLNNRQPDHLLNNRSSAGPSIGSMKGVPFGTSTDRDRDEEYLTHFFKAVDSGVNAILRNDAAPLVLAGVEYEFAIYRRVNTYHRLLDRTIDGSPDGLPSRTLHERAMKIVMQTLSEPLQKSLAHIEKHRDSSRISTNADAVVKAAWQGRVSDLLLSEGAERWGKWNEEKQDIEPAAQPEELLNAAAVQTIRHGGQAFVLRPSDMAIPAEIAAALRF